MKLMRMGLGFAARMLAAASDSATAKSAAKEAQAELQRRSIQVFISHSWSDKMLAEKVSTDLTGPIVEVWQDYRWIRPGSVIWPEIDKALRATDMVVLLWSAAAEASEDVQAEIEHAHQLGLPIVPCFLEYDRDGRPSPPLPVALTGVLGVNFHNEGIGRAVLARHVGREGCETVVGELMPSEAFLRNMAGPAEYLGNHMVLRDRWAERDFWTGKLADEMIEHLAQDLGAARRWLDMIDEESDDPALRRFRAELARLVAAGDRRN